MNACTVRFQLPTPAPILVNVARLSGARSLGVGKVFIENDEWGSFLLVDTEEGSFWMRMGVTWCPEDGVQSAIVRDGNRRVLWEGHV